MAYVSLFVCFSVCFLQNSLAFNTKAMSMTRKCNYHRPGPAVIKRFHAQLSFILLINVKMPTLVETNNECVYIFAIAGYMSHVYNFPVSLMTEPRRYFFSGSFYVCLYYAVLSVPCSLLGKG